MLQITTMIQYDVLYSLWMMHQGMLGIFLFMGVFYLLIYGLEKLIPPKGDK
ncbi:MAG TPA: hypothetical protein PKI59_04040 [Candidatus Cloacimonadota bacterium]|jgi:hypothetical protein|nr:hypothetical protein [Candidatus Cloacimonadota bacterium]